VHTRHHIYILLKSEVPRENTKGRTKISDISVFEHTFYSFMIISPRTNTTCMNIYVIYMYSTSAVLSHLPLGLHLHSVPETHWRPFTDKNHRKIWRKIQKMFPNCLKIREFLSKWANNWGHSSVFFSEFSHDFCECSLRLELANILQGSKA